MSSPPVDEALKADSSLPFSPTPAFARDQTDEAGISPSISTIPAGPLRGWRLYCVQLCLFLSVILSVMDTFVVATALETIGQAFEDFHRLQWVMLAYLLTYLGFALIFTRISDVIGRKWTTIAALAILMVFSLGAGLSQSLTQVIVFRALQGVGGAGLYSMAFVSLPEVTPPEKFPLMAAVTGIVFTVSAILGPIVGGVIATHSTWRWVFLFNVPCCDFVIVLVLVSWPNTVPPGDHSFNQVDLPGCLLYIAASVLLVFALQDTGAGFHALNSGLIVSCLCIASLAAVSLAVWIWYCSRPGPHSILPLFRVRVLRHRILAINLLISILVGYIFYTLLVELPKRFQIVNGMSPQGAGISLLPVSGASALGSVLGGAVSRKRNFSFYTLMIGSAFMLLGERLLYGLKFDRSITSQLYGFECLIGFGTGLVFSSTTIFVKLYAEVEDAASAQGLMAQSRIVGGCIGLSLATNIANRHLASGLSDVLSSEQIALLWKSHTSIETFAPNQVETVLKVFSNVFKAQMETCAILGSVCLTLCFFTWDNAPPSLTRLPAQQIEMGNRTWTSG